MFQYQEKNHKILRLKNVIKINNILKKNYKNACSSRILQGALDPTGGKSPNC